MADTKIRLEIVSDSDLQDEHLCYILSQGLHLTEPEEYRALVESPRFRCGHCGRTARSRSNLCIPVDLKK
jgi:hypothetical protein